MMSQSASCIKLLLPCGRDLRRRALIAAVIVAVTSIILKFTWYDHLKELEHINEYSRKPEAAQAVTPA